MTLQELQVALKKSKDVRIKVIDDKYNNILKYCKIFLKYNPQVTYNMNDSLTLSIYNSKGKDHTFYISSNCVYYRKGILWVRLDRRSISRYGTEFIDLFMKIQDTASNCEDVIGNTFRISNGVLCKRSITHQAITYKTLKKLELCIDPDIDNAVVKLINMIRYSGLIE